VNLRGLSPTSFQWAHEAFAVKLHRQYQFLAFPKYRDYFSYGSSQSPTASHHGSNKLEMFILPPKAQIDWIRDGTDGVNSRRGCPRSPAGEISTYVVPSIGSAECYRRERVLILGNSLTIQATDGSLKAF
jgi:hypothetical protein